MFQTHPLNANGKLLRRFYEPLVLLSVLDPTRGADRPDLTTDRELDDMPKLWRDFLNELSWLCDFETGGDTVTSVAAQQTIENVCFWVTSNSKIRKRVSNHIEWLLARLTQICISDQTATEEAQNELINRCIQFSSVRVKAYTRWLLLAIEKAKTSLEGQISPEDELLFQELHRLEKFADKPLQLCAMAYEFRQHQSMHHLRKRHNAHSSRGVWFDIRHYVGRLGCWTKAVRILVQGAQSFPQRVENAQVKVIEPNELIDRPEKDHLTDLNGVVRRMLQTDQAVLAQELTEALAEVSAMSGITEEFRERYSNFKPRPHAELLVLEHFHNNNLEFVANDRYIGCSKPSCYCCNIYMQLHPGGFSSRPCHGNLWINWAPPIPLPTIAPKQKTAARPQDHHTFKMLQNMIPRIRQDLQDQILSRRPKRSRLPDSTTGISSVAVVYNAGRAIRADHAEALVLSDTHGFNSSSATLTGATMQASGPSDTSQLYDTESIDQYSEMSCTPSRAGSSLHEDESDSHSYERFQLTIDDEDEDVILFRGRCTAEAKGKQ